MVIQKGEKEYIATRTQSGWMIARSVGGVKVDYHVSKEIAPDEEALQKYIHESDLF